jgi:hypothetical protein
MWVGQSGKAFSEFFSLDESIREVKERICQRVPNLEWTDIKLSLDGGDFLQDKAPLSTCNIPPYARVQIHAPSLSAIEAEPSAKPLSAESNLFQVFVKTLNGRTITVWVGPLSTVKELKIKVKEKDGLGEDDQRLLFGGKELRDPNTPLREYNIQKENTIQLVGRLKGGVAILHMYCSARSG